MRIRGILHLLMAFWIGSVGVAAAETLDRIVAVVNGDIILYSELKENVNKFIKNAPQGMTPLDQAKMAQLERNTLQDMIRDRLVEQEAARMKIQASLKDVEDAIEDIKKGNHLTDAQLDESIAKEGKTKEQFRAGIAKELVRMRLLDRILKSKTVVTEAQIDAYIRSGKPIPQGRTSGPSVPAVEAPPVSAPSGTGKRIAVIFLPFSGDPDGGAALETEKFANELHAKLKKGSDFAVLARQYSKGPAAAGGGDIGYVADDELSPEISKAVKGLKAGQFTEVVKVSSGYYIVKILGGEREEQKEKEKKKETPGPVGDTAVRETVRAKLYNEELGRKADEWVKDLQSRAYIQILL